MTRSTFIQRTKDRCAALSLFVFIIVILIGIAKFCIELKELWEQLYSHSIY